MSDARTKAAAQAIVAAVRDTILEIIKLHGSCPLGPVYAALPPPITLSVFYAIVDLMVLKGEIVTRGHCAYPPMVYHG